MGSHLRCGVRILCEGGVGPPPEVTVAFIDDHRQTLGVEPVCRALQIAPSTYYQHKAQEVDTDLRSPRQKRDDELRQAIQRVWDDNIKVDGARKIWRQLAREGFGVARCTVERLMRSMGLCGVVRGKVKRTTIGSNRDPRPLDLVQRRFKAARPNQLWVADFTYVVTWTSVVYVAFVIDVLSRMIVHLACGDKHEHRAYARCAGAGSLGAAGKGKSDSSLGSRVPIRRHSV
jgi:transposase InsO family protein